MVAENSESLEAVQEVQPEPKATTDDESTSFLYFSYGSNMLAERIHVQVTGAVFMTTAVLVDFELCFFDRSKRWHGAVASIERKPDTRVWGCVWRVPNSLAAELDKQECGYRRLDVDVTLHNHSGPSIPSSPMRCRTYQYSNPDRKLNRPSPHYRQVIITGALEHGLPSAYVEWIVNSFPTNDYWGKVELKLKAIEHLNSLENSSNEHREQRQQNEVTGAVFMTTAVLVDFELCFFDRSERWHGAVASIERKPDTRVWGCVWRVPNFLAVELDEQECDYLRLDATIVQSLHSFIMQNMKEKEAAFLMENISGLGMWALCPRNHHNITDGPVAIEHLSHYARRTEANGIVRYKIAVLLLIDPGLKREPFCLQIHESAPQFIDMGAVSTQVARQVREDFDILFLFFSSNVGIARLANSLVAILKSIVGKMDAIAEQ